MRVAGVRWSLFCRRDAPPSTVEATRRLGTRACSTAVRRLELLTDKKQMDARIYHQR
jgi:hypothetical protein